LLHGKEAFDRFCIHRMDRKAVKGLCGQRDNTTPLNH